MVDNRVPIAMDARERGEYSLESSRDEECEEWCGDLERRDEALMGEAGWRGVR